MSDHSENWSSTHSGCRLIEPKAVVIIRGGDDRALRPASEMWCLLGQGKLEALELSVVMDIDGPD
jgi:hypothetical protein